MKYNKNIIYIISSIILLLVIGLFNYIADPLDLRKEDNQNNLFIDKYPRDIASYIIKSTKDKKYSYIIMGSSVAKGALQIAVPNRNGAFLCFMCFDVKDMKDYLEFFLNLHPEVKHVVFTIEYNIFFHPVNIPLPVIKSEKLTIKEISKVYFSLEITKLSLKKIRTVFQSNNNETNNNYYIFERQIRNTYNIPKSFHREQYDKFSEIFKILNNRNIKTTYVIPPYHALYNTELSMNNLYKNTEDIKRFVVEQNPNSRILDFAFVNEYTSLPIEKTWYYWDILHPNTIFGHIIRNIVFNLANNPIPQDKIYFELNQENINSILKKEEELLNNYINMNKEYIENFRNQPIDPNYSIKIYYNDLPKEIKKYIITYRTK